MKRGSTVLQWDYGVANLSILKNILWFKKKKKKSSHLRLGEWAELSEAISPPRTRPGAVARLLALLVVDSVDLQQPLRTAAL